MSSAESVKQSTKKRIIKPLTATEFKSESVKFSNVKNNTELGLKWIDTNYSRGDAGDEKFLVVARGCIVKTYGKAEFKGKDGKESKAEQKTKDGKPRKDKYSVFMAVKDNDFIEMVKTYEKYLEQIAHENSPAWFDNDFSIEECHEQLKPLMPNNEKTEKYGYSIGGVLSRDFTCKSKIDEVPDVSDLNVALARNTIVDVCFHFNKVKLLAGDYRLGLEITQINIVGINESTGESHGLKPEDFAQGKITLTPIQQHEKGGKFCKVLYDDHPVRVYLENVVGRILKFEKEGISYVLSIRLNDLVFRKMVENMDEEIFNLLVTNSKEYLGTKKTAKLARPMIKPIFSFSKSDQEKIKKGEKPIYDPSIWIKIYYSEEKGFDGKIINAETDKVIQNTEDLINKDLNISSLDFYSRHIWFSPKGVSTNFTLGKCKVSYETTEYDMDNIDSATGNDEENADGEEVEAANSDDE
jgi:succinate dehydrogenase flavin-adding protein (antitoxin of CptAB toxin-antitoxin module)